MFDHDSDPSRLASDEARAIHTPAPASPAPAPVATLARLLKLHIRAATIDGKEKPYMVPTDLTPGSERVAAVWSTGEASRLIDEAVDRLAGLSA